MARSFSDGTLVTINITETIGQRTKVPKAEKRNDDTCFWLDPDWTTNTPELRKSVIIPYFVMRAAEAGFKITGSWEASSSSATVPFGTTPTKIRNKQKQGGLKSI